MITKIWRWMMSDRGLIHAAGLTFAGFLILAAGVIHALSRIFPPAETPAPAWIDVGVGFGMIALFSGAAWVAIGALIRLLRWLRRQAL